MFDKIFGVIAWGLLVLGLVTATLAAATYGASFFFEFDSKAAGDLFDAGCGTIVTGMVLIMWNER